MNKRPKGGVRPLLKDLEQDRGHKLIAELEAVAKGKRGTMRETVDKEINYFGSNLHRMKYKQGHQLGWQRCHKINVPAVSVPLQETRPVLDTPRRRGINVPGDLLAKWTLAHPLPSLTLGPI